MNGVLVVHSERGAVLFAKAYAGGFGLKLDEPADPGEDQEQGDEGDDPQPPPPRRRDPQSEAMYLCVVKSGWTKVSCPSGLTAGVDAHQSSEPFLAQSPFAVESETTALPCD
jgi:hypothetical protein